MKVTGKVKEKLPIISGNSNGKDWSRTTLPVEIDTEFGTKVLAFETFKEEVINQVEPLSTGDFVEVVYAPNSNRNEENGIVRYFSSLNLISVRKVSS